jgi:anaerobic ribonucleoside-triphosphate reductase activating protein
MTDTDEILDEDILIELLKKYSNAITCVCFMGGDVAPQEVEKLSIFLHEITNNCIKTAWYSGKQHLPENFGFRHFDFIKLGLYIKHLGGFGQYIYQPTILLHRKRNDGRHDKNIL